MKDLVREGEARDAFLSFASWAVANSEPQRIALGMQHHVEFFALLAQLAKPEWTSHGLLRLFGAAGLRKYELAARWVEQELDVSVAPQHRLESAESRRVTEQLAGVPENSFAQPVIKAFADAQLARLERGEISIRTVRMSLRPAVDLMQSIDWQALPAQSHLELYLKRAPGQRAALFAFVTFVRSKNDIDLAMPRPRKSRRMTDLRRVHERHLNTLLDETPRAPNFVREWFAYSLAYFHKVSLVNARRLLANGDVTKTSEGYVLTSASNQYWLPEPPEPRPAMQPPEG
jgi:hypothetical protein